MTPSSEIVVWDGTKSLDEEISSNRLENLVSSHKHWLIRLFWRLWTNPDLCRAAVLAVIRLTPILQCHPRGGGHAPL